MVSLQPKGVPVNMALSVRYERDGLVLPRAIGGSAALDLVNTLAGWDRPSGAPAHDYLLSFDHLVLWSASVGVVSDADVPSLRRAGRRDLAATDEVLHRAKQLRSSVHEILTNHDAAAKEQALRDVQDLASRALADARMQWETAATLAFAEGVRRPLDTLAWHCLLFLGTADATRARACDGRDCGWLFVDRTGRRRWCRMEWCGNRSKVRTHARRHQV